MYHNRAVGKNTLYKCSVCGYEVKDNFKPALVKEEEQQQGEEEETTDSNVPVIDGEWDDIYENAVHLAIDGKYNGGHKPAGKSFGDAYWYAYDGKLYLYIEVNDTTTEDDASKDPWCRDEIEILFQTDREGKGTLWSGNCDYVEQYRIVRYDETNLGAEYHHAIADGNYQAKIGKNDATGYTAEFCWEVADVINVKDGQIYAFIAINDGLTGGEIWSSHNTRVQNGLWSGGNWVADYAYDALDLNFAGRANSIKYATATVDGKLDDAYLTSAMVINSGVIFYGAGVDTPVSGTTYLLWDENYLYACTVVTDDTVIEIANTDNWMNDSVELWINDTNGRCKSIATAGGAFGFGTDGDGAAATTATVDGTKIAVTKTATGYITEVAYNMSDLAAGKTLGLSLQLNNIINADQAAVCACSDDGTNACQQAATTYTLVKAASVDDVLSVYEAYCTLVDAKTSDNAFAKIPDLSGNEFGVGYSADGDMACFLVDFGKKGATQFSINFAHNAGGNSDLDIYCDGAKLGTISAEPTGGWTVGPTDYTKTFTLDCDIPAGEHIITVKFVGNNSGSFRNVSFVPGEEPVEPVVDPSEPTGDALVAVAALAVVAAGAVVISKKFSK